VEEEAMEGLTEEQQIELAFEADPVRAKSLAPKTHLNGFWNPGFAPFRGNTITDRKDSYGSSPEDN
jgi:hypothetical protein